MKTLLITASLLFAGNSFADVLYTNLGPGHSFGGSVTAECSDCTFSMGTVFTATTTGNLAQILVPISNSAGTLTFDLLTDSGGQPGTLLESWTNVPVSTDFFPPLLTLMSAVNPLVSSGGTYWFLAIVQQQSEFAWATSTQLSTGGFWTNVFGQSLFDMVQVAPGESPQAIELDSAVPEPATWALLGCGLFALAVCRKKISA